MNTPNHVTEKTTPAACCGGCDCSTCSCGCKDTACRCQEQKCDCGCRKPAPVR